MLEKVFPEMEFEREFVRLYLKGVLVLSLSAALQKSESEWFELERESALG